MKMIKIIAIGLALMASTASAYSWCYDNGIKELNAPGEDNAKKLYDAGLFVIPKGGIWIGGAYDGFPNGAAAIAWGATGNSLYLSLDQPWADAALNALQEAQFNNYQVKIFFCHKAAGVRAIDRVVVFQ